MLELSTILAVTSCAGKCSLHNRELAAEEICIYECREITLRRECHLRVKRMFCAELRVPLFVLRNDPFRSLSESIERHLSWAPIYLDVLEYQTNGLIPLTEGCAEILFSGELNLVPIVERERNASEETIDHGLAVKIFTSASLSTSKEVKQIDRLLNRCHINEKHITLCLLRVGLARARTVTLLQR